MKLQEKYYIKKPDGYNPCILGNKKYRDPKLNILPNCVGWATARFNDLGNFGYCKYLGNTNAENFINYVKTQGLTLGSIPKKGSCMVWEGKEGVGHVAIVEEVKSSSEVVTSESGWNSTVSYYTKTRKKGTGNWGLDSKFIFKGFLYNPKDLDEYWSVGKYKVLIEKALRTKCVLSTSTMIKSIPKDLKENCIIKLGKVYIKKQSIIEIKQIYNDSGRIWGKVGSYWIVLCNKDGTPQSVKI